MTPRMTQLRRSLFSTFCLMLTLAAGQTLTAGDDLADRRVVLRPVGTTQPPVSSPFDYSNPNPFTNPGYFDGQYTPDYRGGPPASVPSEAETRQLKITGRYQDSRMLGVLQRTNMNQLTQLYSEVSRMIDSRHVSPLSYEARNRAAIEGLMEALNNPAFLQVAGYRSAVSTQAVQAELRQLAQSPARSATDSIGMMQHAAEIANRRLGLRREAVALEFLNSTLDSLDKYSAFVPAQTGYGPGASLEEQLVGIGVELKKDPNGALINDVLENSPAFEGRLQRGDLIVGINNQPLRGMGVGQIADLISGPAGSTVNLRVARGGNEFSIGLRRRSFYVSSVSGAQMLGGDVGYVRLKQFSQSSKSDLEKAMWPLHQQGMRSLVLDIRGNPGGLLTQAIEVSNLFLPSGRIVATRGRTQSDNSDESATWAQTWSVPLVVLVDGDSASASEIFAAAIQENRRGVIVGRRSYGKGTVQTHFPLQTVSGELKLTTAKFYSPTGREMAGAGVTPDFIVSAGGQPSAGGLVQDPDVRAAAQLIRNGTAAQLATAAGQRRQ